MRALIKSGTGPREARVADTGVPSAGAGQVLLQIEACGLCGSDVHAWRADTGYEWVAAPVVLGHELVGRVAALGEGVESLRIGDRVVPISILGCGVCEVCATTEGPLCPSRTVIGLTHDGGAAEFAVVPAGQVVAVLDQVPGARAVLAEPLSVALHAIGRLPAISPGERVGVCGPGPVGLLAAWALARRGIDAFVLGAERDRALRLPAARALGIEAIAAGDGPIPEMPYWIEASGAESGLAAAISHTRPMGAISIVAMYGRLPTVDANRLVRGQLQLTGSYASLRPDYVEAIELLTPESGIEEVLVREFALEEAVAALEATADGRVVKAALVP